MKWADLNENQKLNLLNGEDDNIHKRVNALFSSAAALAFWVATQVLEGEAKTAVWVAMWVAILYAGFMFWMARKRRQYLKALLGV